MEPLDNLSLSELFDLICAPDEQQAALSDLSEQGDTKAPEKKNNALNRVKTLSSAIQNVLDKVETI
jgi:hypothetical protein